MDTGAQISEAMASVLAFGACREEMWPYDPALFDQEPPKEAYDDARKYEAIAYARVEGVTGTIHAVAQGFPVVFGTCLPGRCYEEAARSGVMPQLTDNERQSRSHSGHAMLIVGYDKKERVFIVRNSWGEGWGDRGYCRIPFDSLDSCSPPEGFWMISELEKQGGFRLIRPGKEMSGAAEPASRVPAMETGGMASTASRMRDEIRSSLEAEMGASSLRADSRRASKPGEQSPQGSQGLKQSDGLTICVACAGIGICSQCHGRGSGCRNCLGSGFCTDCDGTGVR
jgi:hypothetical protein